MGKVYEKTKDGNLKVSEAIIQEEEFAMSELIESKRLHEEAISENQKQIDILLNQINQRNAEIAKIFTFMAEANKLNITHPAKE